MKELIGVATNIYFVLDDETGELLPQTELVLMVSEPRYVIVKDKIMSRRRDAVETIRFTSPQRTLAMLVKAILNNHDEVKRQMDSIRAKSANDEQDGNDNAA